MKTYLLSMYWKRSIHLIVYCLLFSVAGCVDDPETSVPLVQTGFVKNVTEEGAQFNGLVTYEGKAPSTVGFVWAITQNPVLETSSKVIITEFSENSIAFDVTFDLLKDQTYYVRAFGQSGNEVVYGDVVSFESLGSLGPSIQSFHPAEGTSGATFQVSGSNFSGQPLHVIAKLAGVPVEVLAATPTLLTLRIPDNFPVSGKARLSIEVAGREAVSDDFFTLYGAVIEDVMPHSAIGGDTIKITGDDFNPTLAGNVVSFGGQQATVLSATASELLVLVPYQLTGGTSTISVSIANVTTTAQTPFTVLQSWKTMPGSPPPGREGAITFTTTDGIYYGLGSFANYPPAKDLWKYTPSSNTWTRGTDFPGEASSYSVAFSIGSKGYVMLGFNEVNVAYTGFKELWEYDTQADSWQQRADFPGDSRLAALQFVINGKAYVGLGSAGMNYNDLWEYDPVNNSWKELNDFPGSRGPSYGFCVLNGKGYCNKGKELWVYDAGSDTWTRKNNLPGNLANASAVSTGQRIYFFGGSYNGAFVKEFWEYDHLHDQWLRRNDLPPENGLLQSKAFAVGNKVYITGGFETNDFVYRSYLDDLIEFNPKP